MIIELARTLNNFHNNFDWWQLKLTSQTLCIAAGFVDVILCQNINWIVYNYVVAAIGFCMHELRI